MPSSPVAEAPTLPPEVQADTASNKAESRPEGSPAPQGPEEQETKSSGETKGSSSHSDSHSEGEYSGSDTSEHRDPKTGDEAQPPLPNEPVPGDDSTAPPLPNEPLPSDSAAPPLPAEPVPEPEDDGWEYHWNPNDQSYWFYNRFTGVWQKENPRVPTDATAVPQAATTPAATAITATPTVAADGTVLSNPASVAGGYNPAIHGDYDENAWYAQALRAQQASAATSATGDEYATAALFNRHTGRWQTADQGPERHSDEAKSRRQMRAFFDVDAAANMHDGRSLKAERAGIKPSRAELKAFKEKRRAKKEEKRRAWLRD
ncbi:hypothetical protein C7999DRAFT_43075 [Corynascus novoguineensis]|uniref:WW domain-containing protein n=1 Tax=Corynascus novoguineensis TaxID=1126955 RepID=A0AAN7CNM0_9PEZI|nr:hypothetical protein C7999DRAFT_43075 [Corynascus novoguineensis]